MEKRKNLKNVPRKKDLVKFKTYWIIKIQNRQVVIKPEIKPKKCPVWEIVELPENKNNNINV